MHLETNSDTETVLTAIEKYGIRRSLEIFHGMFAFAIIDKTEKKLYLARDFKGEKPLYYGFVNDNFYIFFRIKFPKLLPWI